MKCDAGGQFRVRLCSGRLLSAKLAPGRGRVPDLNDVRNCEVAASKPLVPDARPLSGTDIDIHA
jgi:hypothetical protein